VCCAGGQICRSCLLRRCAPVPEGTAAHLHAGHPAAEGAGGEQQPCCGKSAIAAGISASNHSQEPEKLGMRTRLRTACLLACALQCAASRQCRRAMEEYYLHCHFPVSSLLRLGFNARMLVMTLCLQDGMRPLSGGSLCWATTTVARHDKRCGVGFCTVPVFTAANLSGTCNFNGIFHLASMFGWGWPAQQVARLTTHLHVSQILTELVAGCTSTVHICERTVRLEC
jgi:hypothetical protein